MYSLNEKIRDLKPYEPINGNYKIRLDANESYLRLPEYVSAEIAAKLVDVKSNRYPDPLAKNLCEAFAKHYGILSENVVAGNGSDELISLIFTGFLIKGEVYATLNPDFSMYSFYGALSEGRGIVIDKNPDFSLDCQAMVERCQREGVRLLLFSNPCNPSSLGLSADQVRGIIRALPDTLVVLDEAYMDFWDQSLMAEVNQYDNLLILKTCSKAFGLAALRVGFAVGNTTLVRALKAIKSPYNVNALSQVMAECVLRHKGEARAAKEQILQSTAELYEMLKPLEAEGKLRLLESKTNFVVALTEKAEEINSYLLGIGIAVRAFPGFLRITAGSHNENQQVVRFISEFLNQV